MDEQTPPTSYDLVPYPSAPKPEAHPDRLATIARLFGLTTPPVTRCRVLDVGCGDGATLIPLAYQLPDSEFVGLDLAARHIAAAQGAAAELGLKNISFRVMNLLDAGPELGLFDYIISYGVYSWTPPEVRDKLLAICQEHLAPNGVAYVSYNTYPGWHMIRMIREMLLYHTRHLSDPAQKAVQARALLDFLVEASPVLAHRLATNQAYSLILADERSFLRQQPDAYLLHDLLEEINEPVYFHQFVEHAERHGLRYLGEATLSTMLANHFMPSQIAEPLQEMATTGLAMEQYMDFLRNRTFRQTLLCHKDVVLDRDLKPERLAGLYTASPAHFEEEKVEIHSAAEAKFTAPNEASISVELPINKAALLILTRVWPQAISFEELILAARSLLNPAAPPVYSAASLDRDAEQIGATLLTAYALNLVELRTSPPPLVAEPSEYPQASALARRQIRQGQAVTNQRHEVIILSDDLSRHVLPYLDGQHNRAALLEALEHLTTRGIFVAASDGRPAGSSEQRQEILSQALEHCLYQLARSALLVG